MKKIAKRFIAAVSCAAMVISVVGCGNNKQSTESTKQSVGLTQQSVESTKQSEESAKENEKVTKVEVWSHDAHSKTVMNELVKDWNETRGKEIGLEIVYTVKEGDIKQAVDMAMISEQAPDFFTSVNVTKYSDSGEIYPINDLPGGEEMIAKYDQTVLKSTSFKGVDGKIYCLPASVITFGLVYNKDMFKKYGIVDENGEPTPPKTFEEVREYAKIMTNEAEQDFGIILPMKWGSFYETDVVQLTWGTAGRAAFDCVNGVYDYSVYKPVYEMYMGLKEDGSIFPGAESLDNDMARAYFAERNIGMKFAGSYDVGVFNSQFPAKCDWGVAPYPVEDPDNCYKQYMTAGGHMAVTTAAVEKLGADKAMEILEFFYSDELARVLYEEGMALPHDFSIVEDITFKEGLTGWKEFAELIGRSTSGFAYGSTELTGEDKHKAVFMNKVWNGTITVDEAIVELDERYNRGMQTYYKNNPNKKLEDKLIPDWNSKID